MIENWKVQSTLGSPIGWSLKIGCCSTGYDDDAG